MQKLFSIFDINGDGTIDYDEFLRQVRGEMNPQRRAIAAKAFKKLDKDGSGVIDLNDIRGVYNAKMHPDVSSGKRTEDEILGEFLETFEQHHSSMKGNQRDQTVTHEEFIEYYNNISASIDNDQYFELMMTNAWKLGDDQKYAKGWANG